jgi:hypothetical protein
MLRYGIQPSTAPVGVTSDATPSVSSSSGAKVSRASRAPRAGSTPIALARIAPSPRQASAQAVTQISASVGLTPLPVTSDLPATGMFRPGDRK